MADRLWQAFMTPTEAIERIREIVALGNIAFDDQILAALSVLEAAIQKPQASNSQRPNMPLGSCTNAAMLAPVDMSDPQARDQWECDGIVKAE